MSYKLYIGPSENKIIEIDVQEFVIEFIKAEIQANLKDDKEKSLCDEMIRIIRRM